MPRVIAINDICSSDRIIIKIKNERLNCNFLKLSDEIETYEKVKGYLDCFKKKSENLIINFFPLQ